MSNRLGKIFVGTVIVIIAFLMIWFGPKLQLISYKDSLNEGIRRYIEVEDNLRKTWIQLIGGAVFLYGLYLTYRRIRASEKQTEAFIKQTEASLDGQITERYTRAIEQLGATNDKGDKKTEIRLGGIYALERIARDSEKDHWAIMEILTTYVRENSPLKKEGENNKKATTDIQAILTVLGRREHLEYEKKYRFSLNLIATNLQKIRLVEANLQKAILREANLQEAFLKKVNLEKAKLAQANIRKSYLEKANLRKANLIGAKLQKAYLTGANLQKVRLSGGDLQETILIETNLLKANLVGASLQDSNLKAANLQKANLNAANLTGASLNETKLRGAINLNVEQLCTAKTLYLAELDSELTKGIIKKCPNLLELPK